MDRSPSGVVPQRLLFYSDTSRRREADQQFYVPFAAKRNKEFVTLEK